MVIDWANIHMVELIDNWNFAILNESLKKIDPLI
jgi:hypothetical protein